ncbi:heavy-metal-associated domain-containing protein [Rhizobium sp. LC145]|uniref:heavy-metal-associated domain-containing protein n=1 Tax=Rhizobium sp. LC145 TaxID=1120688 RepID=UPI00062A2415|nr:heavy-metal-associated domain-containing protein [Rhizobium sp. LC145]KKX29428.1 heavy metal-binding protein [Rhizobium sp. LC145]MDX3927968.1 heavy-metal-associated domain-containing protein [Shinella sp.]TKT66195.1 heavy-metal-associated domain-containing protein [Rhizobiaceae bacterium LC148]
MYKFEVPDMTCGHCASTVEKAIRMADPNASAKVDLDSKTVSVETKIASEVISASIADAGYTPSLSK